jgi:hypothetical protein
METALQPHRDAPERRRRSLGRCRRHLAQAPRRSGPSCSVLGRHGRCAFTRVRAGFARIRIRAGGSGS